MNDHDTLVRRPHPAGSLSPRATAVGRAGDRRPGARRDAADAGRRRDGPAALVAPPAPRSGSPWQRRVAVAARGAAGRAAGDAPGPGGRGSTGSGSPGSSSSAVRRPPRTHRHRPRVDDAMTVAEAAALVGFTPLVPEELGEPDAVDVSADRVIVSMSVVHRRRPGAPRPVRRPARLPDRQDLPGRAATPPSRGPTRSGSSGRTRWCSSTTRATHAPSPPGSRDTR